jgi:hypothetical protein
MNHSPTRIVGYCSLVTALAWLPLGCSDIKPRLAAADPQSRSQWSLENEADVLLAREAVAYALGTESVVFKDVSLRGTTLGTEYDTSKATFHPDLMFSAEFYAPSKNAPVFENGVRVIDSVLVDRANREIVGIVAHYSPATLANMGDVLISVFGKTLNEIQKDVNLDGVQFTTLKYLFPGSVVRVCQSVPRGAGLPHMRITVIDRQFAEKTLAAYAAAVIRSCNWIKENIDGMTPTEPNTVPDATKLTPLADTVSECIKESAIACFYDAAVKNLTLGEEGEWPKPGVADVAGFYVAGGTMGFVCDPLVSGSNDVPRLCNHISAFYDEIPPSLLETDANDLMWVTASFIVQQKFPPAGDSIRIELPKDKSEEAAFSSRRVMRLLMEENATPAQRMQMLRFRSFSKRHEWTDVDGNQVLVGANGSITVVVKLPGFKKGL